MLAYGIIAAMAVAGYLAAPAWIVLLGVAGAISEGWWRKLWPRPNEALSAWSSKTWTYFVTGILASIGLSAIGYNLGRLTRHLIG